MFVQQTLASCINMSAYKNLPTKRKKRVRLKPGKQTNGNIGTSNEKTTEHDMETDTKTNCAGKVNTGNDERVVNSSNDKLPLPVPMETDDVIETTDTMATNDDGDKAASECNDTRLTGGKIRNDMCETPTDQVTSTTLVESTSPTSSARALADVVNEISAVKTVTQVSSSMDTEQRAAGGHTIQDAPVERVERDAMECVGRELVGRDDGPIVRDYEEHDTTHHISNKHHSEDQQSKALSFVKYDAKVQQPKVYDSDELIYLMGNDHDSEESYIKQFSRADDGIEERGSVFKSVDYNTKTHIYNNQNVSSKSANNYDKTYNEIIVDEIYYPKAGMSFDGVDQVDPIPDVAHEMEVAGAMDFEPVMAIDNVLSYVICSTGQAIPPTHVHMLHRTNDTVKDIQPEETEKGWRIIV